MAIVFIVLSAFILFYMNKLMESFCEGAEIPEDKKPQVFRTANILTTLLLISTYLEMLFY